MSELAAPVDAGAGPPREPRPWDRQPRETAVAYSAFVAYRDEDPADRRYAEIARRFGKHPQTVERWGRTYGWIARALAWDEECDRKRQAARLSEIERAARRQAGLGLRMQSLAKQGADAILERPGRIASMKASEIAALAAVGVKIERDALGVPDRHQHDVRALVAQVGGGAPGIAPAGGPNDDFLTSALRDPAVAEAADLLAERLEDLARRDGRAVDGEVPAALEAGAAPEPPDP